MKLHKKTLLFLALIVFLFLISVLLMKRWEINSASYESYAEVASTPGLLDAGWIPTWLPKSAFDIKESHDIDTNESWLMFGFLARDEFYASCTSIDRSKVTFFPIEGLKKFPAFVEHNFEKLHSDSSLVFYECGTAKNKTLAVDNKKNIAYVWGLSH